MKSGIRTIIYSGIALLFMGLFAFCCIHNGAILPEGLAQYIGQGPVEVTDAKMLFEILGMIYPFFAILLFALLCNFLCDTRYPHRIRNLVRIYPFQAAS